MKFDINVNVLQYKESVASYRTGLATEVLNDDCEFVRKGSKDCSFKHKVLNECEEIFLVAKMTGIAMFVKITRIF